MLKQLCFRAYGAGTPLIIAVHFVLGIVKWVAAVEAEKAAFHASSMCQDGTVFSTTQCHLMPWWLQAFFLGFFLQSQYFSSSTAGCFGWNGYKALPFEHDFELSCDFYHKVWHKKQPYNTSRMPVYQPASEFRLGFPLASVFLSIQFRLRRD